MLDSRAVQYSKSRKLTLSLQPCNTRLLTIGINSSGNSIRTHQNALSILIDEVQCSSCFVMYTLARNIALQPFYRQDGASEIRLAFSSSCIEAQANSALLPMSFDWHLLSNRCKIVQVDWC